MPEEKNTAGAGNGGGEGGNADDQNQNGAGENGDQNTNDGSGDGDGKNKDGDDDGSSNDDGDDKGDDKGSQNKDDDGDDEPAVRKRKSAKDYIIERQARKIEKLKGSKNDDDGGSGDDDGDGEIDQEDEKIINKVVDKRLAPIFKQQAEAEDEQEVQQFIKDNPDFKPYADKVRRDMKHPSRSQVPIKDLFYAAAGDNLMKIGAKRAENANDEANRGNAGGGSSRGEEDGGKVDYSKSAMSDEEFEKKREEIRQKAR